MRTSHKQRFAAESATWFEDGQINRNQRDSLLERYRTDGIALSQIVRGLGIFALFCVGCSVLAFLAAISESLFMAALLLAAISGVSIHRGLTLSTETPRTRSFAGSALITTGLITIYGFFCVLYLICGGDSSSALPYTVNLYLTALVSAALAYRSRTTTPLMFAIVCLFHAVGGPHNVGVELDDFLDLQDQRRIAFFALLVVLIGFYHERVLEMSSLKRHTDFGDSFIKLGLLYLNSSLFTVSSSLLLLPTWWDGMMLILALVCCAEVLAGAAVRDSRLVGFGAIFLQLLLYTRIFVHFLSTASVATAMLAAGVLTVLLGFLFDRLSRRSQVVAQPRPTPSKALRRELSELVRVGLISPEQASQLRDRYSLSNWELGGLSQWFILSGTLLTLASIGTLITTSWDLTLTDLVFALTVAVVALILAAYHFRGKGKEASATASEFLAAVAYVGWSFALAKLLSTGRHSPTLLLYCDLGVVMSMAYYFANTKILYLGHALLYASVISLSEDLATDHYVLGLNFAFRTLFTAGVLCVIGFLHQRRDVATEPTSSYPRGFSTAWYFSGLVVAELSFCVLAIEGNGTFDGNYTSLSLLLINLLWAATNALLIAYSAKLSAPIFTTFGVLFLIVQPYLLFFRFVAPSLGATLSFFIAGASALVLVSNLEAFAAFRKPPPGE